jgi:hypothetical protein
MGCYSGIITYLHKGQKGPTHWPRRGRGRYGVGRDVRGSLVLRIWGSGVRIPPSAPIFSVVGQCRSSVGRKTAQRPSLGRCAPIAATEIGNGRAMNPSERKTWICEVNALKPSDGCACLRRSCDGAPLRATANATVRATTRIAPNLAGRPPDRLGLRSCEREPYLPTGAAAPPQGRRCSPQP